MSDMERKELGYIQEARFGWGGYQDCAIGVNFKLGGKAWSVLDFKGAWGIDHYEGCKWTHESRLRELGEVCMFVRDLLQQSRKTSLDELIGLPIEATFDGNLLKSWRLFTEVMPQAAGEEARP